MTIQPPQRNRAHNFRIVGTIRNEADSLNLDWQPLESKLLSAAAYVAARRMIYLRFQTGEIYVTSPFLRSNTTSSSLPTPRVVTSSATFGINSPTNASVAAKFSSKSSRRSPDAYDAPAAR